MTDKPRAYTIEEVRKMFLGQIYSYIDYWEKDSRRPDVRGKLEGLAFSIRLFWKHPWVDRAPPPRKD